MSFRNADATGDVGIPTEVSVECNQKNIAKKEYMLFRYAAGETPTLPEASASPTVQVVFSLCL